MLLTERRAPVVVGLAVDQCVAWGALHYAFAVLAPAIASGLALPPLRVATAFSVGLLAAAGAAPWIGRAITRSGARVVLRAGVALGGGALLVLATARDGGGLVAGMILLGFAQAASLYEPAFAAAVAALPRRSERALLAITIVGGFASTVFLPFTAALLERCDWRRTLVVLALVFVAIGGAVRFALLPDARVPSTAAQLGHVRLTGLAPLAAGFAVQAFVASGVMLFLVPTLGEGGLSVQAAAVVTGIAGAMQVPGRIAFTFLPRSLSATHRWAVLLGAQAVGIFALTQRHPLALAGGVVLYGAASGVVTLARATTLLERFGRAGYPRAGGMTGSFTLVARALAPFAVELAHRWLSRRAELVLLAVLLVAAVPLFARAPSASAAEEG